MADEPTIIVTVTPEPAEFHGDGDPAQQRVYAVHVAFDGSREKVQELLGKEWSFYTFQWDDSNATKVGDVLKSTSAERLAWHSERLTHWLNSEYAQPSEAGGTPSTKPPDTRTVLQGSIAWDAPIPQMLGLTYLVTVKIEPGERLPEKMLIAPVSGPLEGGQEDDGVITFEPVDLGDGSSATLTTNVVDINNENETELPEPLTANGFLRTTFDVEAFRILESIEAKGASLIGSLPVFLGFLSDLDALPEDDHGELTEDDHGELIRTGCALALDPLRIALLDPVISSTAAAGSPPRTRREGILLGSLAACVATQFESLQNTLSEDDRSAACMAFLGNLQDALASALPNAYECLRDHSDVMRTGAEGALVEWLPNPPQGPVTPTLSQVKERLGTVSTFLGSERGIEMLLKSLLRSIATDTLIIASASAASTHVSEAVSALRQGLKRYLDQLDGPVNAADAVRADVGYWTLRQVLSQEDTDAVPPAGGSVTPKLDQAERIADKLRKWNFLQARLSPECDAFEKVALPESIATKCNEYFANAWGPAVETLLPVASGSTTPPSRKRFQPDTVPQPLPISISPVPGGDGLGDFTSRFNGIGVVICGKDSWAHANLAHFHIWAGAGATPAPTYASASEAMGIRAFLPVAVDGRREMFLRYHGFPLSSDAYRETMRDDGDGSAGRIRPFYECRDAAAAGFAKVPRLIYGGSYEWAAFAVTKGGALPKVLQDSVGPPWKPKADIAGLSFDGEPEIVGKTDYRRRTAVGATTIVDAQRRVQRIGVRYPDVFPLSLDSPRLCLSATTSTDLKSSPFIDLFRNADGTGQLDAGAGALCTLRFDHVLRTGDEASLVAVLMESDAEIGTPQRHVVESGATRSIEMALNSPATDAKALWLRLWLDTSGSRATLSFNPPQLTISEKDHNAAAVGTPPAAHVEKHHNSAAVDTPPVVLVASSPWWSQAFRAPLEAEVIFPRTTWLDWEHWCGNRSLNMYGQKRAPDYGYEAADKHLLTASVLRTLDDDINTLIDRLPDPSVSALIAELTVVDSHFPLPDAGAASADPCVIRYSDDMANAFSSFDKLGVGGQSADKYGEDLRAALVALDRRFRIRVAAVAVKADAKAALMWNTTDGKLVVSVPEGMCAQLTIRPFVEWPDEGHPAFDPGIKELAVGKATIKAAAGHGETSGFVFGGASLTIEGMCDMPVGEDQDKRRVREETFRENHISIRPVRSVRQYGVWFGPQTDQPSRRKLDDGEPDPWRLFSHCELRTQRWRFSGRPIYGWISPKTCVPEEPPHRYSPALELERGVAGTVPPASLLRLLNFEAELFFDRDDADCEFTRVRLTGGDDELLACPWELPSATYFRHAFNFVSRYAGAMQPGKGTPLWPRRQADWSHRVAMLADASRLEITRPQVRCIVPLTTDADDKAEPVTAAPDLEQRKLAPTPPVACILEERPFAVGGLAERMLGEIVTGVGYGFDEKDSRVMPRDFGKETSRDGRLSPWAWIPPADSNLANPARAFVVETEGPVGLHFEEVTSPAPAWSNCQYLLRPRSLDHDRALPEESFLGVQLRRYLDPDWVFDPATDPSDKSVTPSPGPQSWPPGSPARAEHELASMAKAACGPLVRVCWGGDGKSLSLIDFDTDTSRAMLVFTVRRSFLGANYPDGSLPLCEVPLPANPNDKLVLLHMPHGDGSFTISVAIGRATAGVAEGRAVAPLIVGTARWTLAHMLSAKQPDITLAFPSLNEQPPAMARTAMSQPTYREWARTAKNADFLTTIDLDRSDTPIHVSAIKARLDGDGKTLSFRESCRSAAPAAADRWICGSTANSRMPLYVHRFPIGVFTRASFKGGRSYQSFSHAQFIAGRRPVVLTGKPDIDAVAIHELEVPARIVVTEASVGKNKQLEQFTQALIDLRSTGGVPDAENVLLYRLHVRFANSPAVMKEVSPMVTVTTPWGKLTVTAPRGVHTIDLLWTAAAKGKQVGPKARCVFWGDETQCQDPTWEANPPTTEETISFKPEETISVRLSSTLDTELWADVSLLHRPCAANLPEITRDHFDHFDFDWLFSPSTEDTSAASRTLASTLAQRLEPQGRLVSSGEPIPIDRG